MIAGSVDEWVRWCDDNRQDQFKAVYVTSDDELREIAHEVAVIIRTTGYEKNPIASSAMLGRVEVAIRERRKSE